MQSDGERSTPAAPIVFFRLLQAPSVHRPDGSSAGISRKEAALVALLALDGAHASLLLEDYLWPGADRVRSGNNRRKLLSRLEARAGNRLFNDAQPWSLSSDAQVDVTALDSLSSAELLAAGDLLHSCDFGDCGRLDAWLQEKRPIVRRLIADVLAGRAEDLEAQGEIAAALPLAEHILVLMPALEHGVRRLMRLHYRRGDTTAAIRTFEDFEALLREGTGGRPSTETLQLLELVESGRQLRATGRRPMPVSLKHPPQRIGRDREWQAMTRAWAAGQPFLLVGEAGIGKSRLMQDFLQERGHDQGHAIADRARAGDSQTPYALLGRLLTQINDSWPVSLDAATQRELARIAPAFGPAPKGDGQQMALWRAVERLLVASAGAGLQALAVDDLHCADLASIEAFRWMSASRALAGLNFGFATRPFDAGDSARFIEDWLNDSHRPSLIDVEALSQDDIARLIPTLQLALSPDLAAALYRHAGGHAFFTLETLAEMLVGDVVQTQGPLPVPRSVQTLIDRRLAALPDAARDLLRVAAVAGSDLTAARAARLLGCKPIQLAESWADLERLNVLSGTAFVHDLVRERAVQLVPGPVGVALHAALAVLLRDDSSVPPARVAAHFESGEQWAEAGDAWHAAALAARMAGRLVEQARLLQRAAECHREARNGAGEFEASYALLESLMWQHGGAAVLEKLPSLEALANADTLRLKCQLSRAEALVDLERAAEAEPIASAAVLAAQSDAALLARASSVHGIALAQLGRGEEAVATGRRAVDLARDTGQAAQRLGAIRSLVYILYASGRLAAALPLQREALRLAEDLGDLAQVATCHGDIAGLLGIVGNAPSTLRHATQARRLYVEMGLSAVNGTLALANLIVLGSSQAYLARFGDALDSLLEAERLAGDDAAASARARARISLANLWLTLGRSDLARPLVAELPPRTVTGMRIQAELVMARAEMLDGSSGAGHLARIGALMDSEPGAPLVQSAYYEWSFQGDAAGVVERLQSARREAEELGLACTARTLQLREVDRLCDMGGATAIDMAVRGAEALSPSMDDAMSSKVYPPEGWLVLHRAYTLAADREAARQCAARARQWLDLALSTVPPEHRETFLNRNPVNLAVLRLAGR